MIKAIIFDLDGVLIETDKWHFSALNIALQSVGEEPLSWKEHLEIYKGRPTTTKLKMLTERRGLEASLYDQIKKVKQEYTVDMITRFTEKDAEKIEMMRLLKERGYKIAVCSNAIRESVQLMLECGGYMEFIDAWFGNGDVSQPKPHPEIYLRAFARLGVKAHETVIVEDSEVGLESANASGASVCAVADESETNFYRVLSSILHVEKPQVVIPAAGQGKRFYEAGYQHPKPLIQVQGRPMLAHVLDDFGNLQAKNIILMQARHLEQYLAEDIISNYSPGAHFVGVDGLTEGAACTLLLAEPVLNPNAELIIANSDQKVTASVERFVYDMREQKAEGGIMTFHDTNPKWSFASADDTGRVLEVAEKNPISDHATVGIYYWKRAGDFIRSAREMISKDIRVNGEFYVCPVYNEFINSGGDVRIWEISADDMHGLGTPEDLERYVQVSEEAGLTS